MKKIIFLCLLLLSGCYVYHPSDYACQQPRIIYAPAPAPACETKVIKRTVKRTVQIVPESQLRGYIK